MEISVEDAASELGVSQRRVRALIADGRIQARQVSGRWLVEAASLPSSARRGRPMSPEVAWAFLAAAVPPELAPDEAYRWRQRRSRLKRDGEPERLLASWVASRGVRSLFQARRPEGLLTDSRVVPSGLSDDRAGIAAGEFAEGYVRESDLSAVRRDHLLRPGGHGSNVVLHVVDALPSFPVSPLVLAADLAEHDQARERGRARELIAEALR